MQTTPNKIEQRHQWKELNKMIQQEDNFTPKACCSKPCATDLSLASRELGGLAVGTPEATGTFNSEHLFVVESLVSFLQSFKDRNDGGGWTGFCGKIVGKKVFVCHQLTQFWYLTMAAGEGNLW